MKKNKIKSTIYIRIFSALLATYLTLMAGFSIFLISQEKNVESLELQNFALQVNNTVEDVLEGFWIDNEMVIPNKTSVTPMFAKSFDENGKVMSSSDIHSNDIVYLIANLISII